MRVAHAPRRFAEPPGELHADALAPGPKMLGAAQRHAPIDAAHDGRAFVAGEVHARLAAQAPGRGDPRDGTGCRDSS